MAYIKLDVHAPWTLAHLSRDAFAYWIEGTCWAKLHMTDGALPAETFHHRRLASQLVQAGLWIKTEAGYQEVGYTTRQTPAAVIAQRADDNRKRLAAWRQKHTDAPLVTPPVTALHSGTETETETETKRENVRTFRPQPVSAELVLKQIQDWKKGHG